MTKIDDDKLIEIATGVAPPRLAEVQVKGATKALSLELIQGIFAVGYLAGFRHAERMADEEG